MRRWEWGVVYPRESSGIFKWLAKMSEAEMAVPNSHFDQAKDPAAAPTECDSRTWHSSRDKGRKIYIYTQYESHATGLTTIEGDLAYTSKAHVLLIDAVVGGATANTAPPHKTPMRATYTLIIGLPLPRLPSFWGPRTKKCPRRHRVGDVPRLSLARNNQQERALQVQCRL